MTVSREIEPFIRRDEERKHEVQVVLVFDSAGNIRAEIPGPNGQRRKIDLGLDFKESNPEIMAAVSLRRDELRSADARKLAETQTQNIAYVTENYGLRTTRQIWHNAEAIFNRRWKKHINGEAGNLAGEHKNASDSSTISKPKFNPNKALDL